MKECALSLYAYQEMGVFKFCFSVNWTEGCDYIAHYELKMQTNKITSCLS